MTDEYEECDYSGLARIFCAHCQGHKLGDEKPDRLTTERFFDQPDQLSPDDDDEDVSYEIVRRFKSMYSGTCCIDRSHVVKRNDLVSIVQRTDNPMLPVQGVACKNCTRYLPELGQ